MLFLKNEETVLFPKSSVKTKRSPVFQGNTAESLRVHIHKNKKTRLSSRQTSEHGARAGIKKSTLRSALLLFLKNEKTVLFTRKFPEVVRGYYEGN